jgi:hypothetical protein
LRECVAWPGPRGPGQATAGFTAVGVLREKFFLGGRYVDDVLMACVPDAAAGRGMTGAR